MTSTLFKYRWVILLIIIILAGLVFEQFYAVQVVKKNNNVFTGASVAQTPDSGNLSGKDIKTPAVELGNLDIDMANLTEEETASVKAFLKFKKVRANIIPTGIPELYGEELNVSFDQVQDAINKVRVYGPTYGTEENKITLTGDDLERYIKIGFKTACQYCCSVKSLVREDGSAACGCAHSIMMRGLSAYLIKNYPELSDEQVLNELNTWKRAYFPKQTLTETLQALKQSGEEGIEQLLQEFPDFLPQMVGGC